MITTILDLLGSLLLIAGASWFITGWLGIYAGMLAAGSLILLLSYLIDRKGRRREPVSEN